MTASALLLVLLAAGMHATWNLAAKRAGGGLPFVYVASLIIVGLYVPTLVTYSLWRPVDWSWGMTGVVFGSGILKTGYSLYLQRGYRTGDFSLIYPLARGTGPLLSTLAAIAILGERPSGLALAGGALIVASIFYLTGGLAQLARRRVRPPAGNEQPAITPASASARLSVRYGLISGLFIAAYTVWDRVGVTHWAIPPVLYDGGTALTQLALLTPFAWRRRPEVAREWRLHRRHAIVMAVFAPLSYILILTAMQFTPVSYIAPAREISILIGTFFGAKLLGEADGTRRLVAAAVMVVGVMALAWG